MNLIGEIIWFLYTIFAFIIISAATLIAIGLVIAVIVYAAKELIKYGKNKAREGRRVLQTDNKKQQKRNKKIKSKNKTIRKRTRLSAK